MPWSNPEPTKKGSNSSVLKKDVAEQKVLKHTPLEFSAESTKVIETYQKAQDTGSDFRMSDIVKQQTGIKKVEDGVQEEQVQAKLLEKVQEIQESAYQEAYNLGLDEGTQKAFREMSHQIEKGLEEFMALTQHLQQMRLDLFNANEKHLVAMAFHMAKLLAQKEVATDQAQILQIMKSAVQMAQNEDDVKVHISTENFSFIQTLMQQTRKEADFLQKMKIIAEESYGPGDCVVRTNYGEVDSKLETRAQTLWNELEQVMPHPAPESPTEPASDK